MTSKKKTIFFSIEIAARELDSKCLLALETAKRGFRVYIGSFRALKQTYGKTDSSIFFHKSTWRDVNVKRIINELGASFVFLDEELGASLPRSEIKTLITASFRDVSSDKYSDIFALGDNHKAEMESMPNLKGVNIHATGWPRMDFWRDDFQHFNLEKSNEIKKQQGDFYLLVSSFGAISDSSRDEFKKILTEQGLSKHEIVDFKYDEFKRCLKLIKEFSSNLLENEKIIIRPHTSESIDKWNEHIAEYDNIIVCHEGDITPWLLASQGTIQFGSTVAVQAAYMGIPSVQHTVSSHIGATDTPAYEILDQYSSASEMLDVLRKDKETDPKVLRDNTISKLQHLVANLEGPLASEVIADRLSKMDVTPRPPIRINPLKRVIFYVKEKINYLNYLKKKKFRNESGRIKRSKFEKIPNGLNKNDIEIRIKKLAKIRNYAPERIQCRQVTTNLVEVNMR